MKKILLCLITAISLNAAPVDIDKAYGRMEKLIEKCARRANVENLTLLDSQAGQQYCECVTGLDKPGIVSTFAFLHAKRSPNATIERNAFFEAYSDKEHNQNTWLYDTVYGFNVSAVKHFEQMLEDCKIDEARKVSSAR